MDRRRQAPDVHLEAGPHYQRGLAGPCADRLERLFLVRLPDGYDRKPRVQQRHRGMESHSRACKLGRLEARECRGIDRLLIGGVIGPAACKLQTRDVRQILDRTGRLEGLDEVRKRGAIAHQDGRARRLAPNVANETASMLRCEAVGYSRPMLGYSRAR
jgi:hypothetical protein